MCGACEVHEEYTRMLYLKAPGVRVCAFRFLAVPVIIGEIYELAGPESERCGAER